MKKSDSLEWEIFAGEEDIESVPLWKALAQFTSQDLDEGLNENAATINQARSVFARNYHVAFVLSLVFGLFCSVFLIAWLILMPSESTGFFLFLVLSMLVVSSPHLLRHISQYGLKTPDVPLELPHQADPYFEIALGQLQSASGPRAYYFSRFRKRRILLNRRQFFGKLRYFLFSERSADRAMVMRFQTGLSFSADIFLHRADVEKMLSLRKPKHKGGPGRNLKYSYIDAIIALIGDPRLGALNKSDEAKSVRTITGWLADWFEANDRDGSGDAPRSSQLSPYAKKIFDNLKKFS